MSDYDLDLHEAELGRINLKIAEARGSVKACEHREYRDWRRRPGQCHLVDKSQPPPYTERWWAASLLAHDLGTYKVEVDTLFGEILVRAFGAAFEGESVPDAIARAWLFGYTNDKIEV